MTGEITNTTDQFLAEKAEAIRALEREGKRAVFKVACEIGEHLNSVRDRLSRNSSGDGTWLAWLEREFPYWGSQRTAYNYIGIFKFVQKHGGQVATFANSIDLSAVYLLAAPSTPEEARTEVAERIEHGEELTRQNVKDAIDKHGGNTKPPTKSRQQSAHKPKLATPTAEAPPPPATPAGRLKAPTEILEIARRVRARDTRSEIIDLCDWVIAHALPRVAVPAPNQLSSHGGDERQGLMAMAKKADDVTSRSFHEEALEFIGTFSGSAGALVDWWRSKRAERAAITTEEQGILSKTYTAKFNQLEATEEPMSE